MKTNGKEGRKKVERNSFKNPSPRISLRGNGSLEPTLPHFNE
jgi:hypothetical protein